jgi:hypothetical protein
MEHPDRTALNDLPRPVYDSRAITHRAIFSRIMAMWHRMFGEHNFVIGIDRKPARDQRITIEKIALEGATRLNGRKFTIRHGPGLDLDEDEIVTVICETARILMLEEKVRTALNDVRLPATER